MDKLVFDPILWEGRDKGNNSQFWKRATILEIEDYPELTATVLFHHDGRISKGHFMYAMSEVTNGT